MFQLAQTFGVTFITVFRFLLHVQWLGKRSLVRSQSTFLDPIILAGIVELHLSGLIGPASHSGMQKIRIIGFFFENRLNWQFEVRLLLSNSMYLRLNL